VLQLIVGSTPALLVALDFRWTGRNVPVRASYRAAPAPPPKPDKVALRVDAANAFNAVSRAEILERVCEHAPPGARFVHAIYGGQPYVVAGRTLLLSRQGTQKGDPLGMLQFALAIIPLILRVQSECDLELNLWYADDGTLVGSIAEVAKAYQILKDEGPKYCFSLVPHKTVVAYHGL
jgi:hypothetical protein